MPNLRGIITQNLVPRADDSGMIVATEVLINNEAIANQIREVKTHQIATTMMGNRDAGMHTMNMDLKRLVKERKITEEMALRFTTNSKEFESLR